MDKLHPSHVTRGSDASTFDVICVNCDETDQVPGGWGELAKPCKKPVGSGGMTIEQYYAGERAQEKGRQARK